MMMNNDDDLLAQPHNLPAFICKQFNYDVSGIYHILRRHDIISSAECRYDLESRMELWWNQNVVQHWPVIPTWSKEIWQIKQV